MNEDEVCSILGVEPTSDLEAVKVAFRRRALQCHPDTSGTSSEEFIRLSRAYDFLSRSKAPCLSSSPSPGPGHRYAPGRVVYASGFSGSRSSRTATLVWGVGLGLGGMLFAGILLLGRTMVPRTVSMGPSRVVEPTRDSAKRERIARLLQEKRQNGTYDPQARHKS